MICKDAKYMRFLWRQYGLAKGVAYRVKRTERIEKIEGE